MDKTMADKFKCLPNDETKITPSLDYNWWLKRLDTQLNELISNSMRKPYYKT